MTQTDNQPLHSPSFVIILPWYVISWTRIEGEIHNSKKITLLRKFCSAEAQIFSHTDQFRNGSNVLMFNVSQSLRKQCEVSKDAHQHRWTLIICNSVTSLFILCDEFVCLLILRYKVNEHHRNSKSKTHYHGKKSAESLHPSRSACE